MNRETGSKEQIEAGGDPGSGCRTGETSGGTTIDFHSEEFNRTDDLNDFSGNYRTFQSLAGIVTADMRHQMERLDGKRGADAATAVAGHRKNMDPAGSDGEPPPDARPFTVISRGRTLIVDSDAERGMACAEILGDRGLDCTLWVTKKKGSPRGTFPRFAPFRMIDVGALSITGAFGGFSARVDTAGDYRPTEGGSADGAALFDLVLDLQSAPAYAGERVPLGYYAPGTDPAALSEALAELPEMRGSFLRPQFTTLQKNRCLHGRSRTRDCRRCLDICPFGAIRSAGRTVSVDHHLCQGCGGCAMVCPADAIQLVHPSPSELLGNLQDMLEEPSAGASSGSLLVISDSGDTDLLEPPETAEEDRGRLLHFAVDQIGHVGVAMPLSALANGVGRVIVACGAQNAPVIREAAEQQVQMGRAILKGLGMSEERIQFVVLSSHSRKTEPTRAEMGAAEEPKKDNPAISASSSAEAERRSLTRWTAQRLYDLSGRKRPELPLPAGSPFGAVSIDRAACTLCMACAVACPARALSAGGDVPRIELIETRCHQCGLCQEACPEMALSLIPRMLCDPDAVKAPALLNEAEPVRCIECGAPFASQAMIDRIRTKLKGHWMYLGDRQLRRLRMCGTCRTRDALGDREMNSWNQI